MKKKYLGINGSFIKDLTFIGTDKHEKYKGYSAICKKTTIKYERTYNDDNGKEKKYNTDWSDGPFTDDFNQLLNRITQSKDINNYIKLNLFQNPNGRRNTQNVAWLTAYYFDLDIHKEEKSESIDDIINSTLDRINEAIKKNELIKYDAKISF